MTPDATDWLAVSLQHEKELPAMLKKGMTERQIAAEWRCSHGHVQRMRKRMRLSPADKRARYERKWTEYGQSAADLVKVHFRDDGAFGAAVAAAGLPERCFG